MTTPNTAADEAGDLARGFAFTANAFSGDDDGVNVVIAEAEEHDRLTQLAGAVGVVIRDGFSADFADSDVVVACREAALAYRQQEIELRNAHE